MSSDSTAITPPAVLDRDRTVRIAVASVAILASLGFVFHHFFYNQIRFAVANPADWGHTLLIPFMAGYLAWLNRDRLARTPFRTTWIAILPIVLGIAWYMLCWVGPPSIRHHNLQGAGVAMSITGVVLLFAGWRAMRFLWFPLAYLFIFGVTISDRFMNIVTYRLQDIAARGSYVLMRVFGYDVNLSGNTLQIWDNGQMHPLNIAEACSGMRMLVAFLALGVFMAYTMLSRPWQRVALVVLAVPVAILVNVLRVVTLGLLSLVDADMALGDFHSFVGLVWLVPALLMYLGLMWILRRIVVEDGGTERSAGPRPGGFEERSAFRFDRSAKTATIIACLALVAGGVSLKLGASVLEAHLTKKALELRRPLSRIPFQLGDWKRSGEDSVFDKSIIEALGTPHYLSRTYVRDEGTDEQQVMMLHVAYYTGMIDAVPHVPERCFVAGGLNTVGRPEHRLLDLDRSMWMEDDGPVNRRTGQPYSIVRAIDPIKRVGHEVRMPLGDLAIRVWQFQNPDLPGAGLVAGYFFIANGQATARAEEIRVLAFDLTDEYAYYAKVEFSMPYGGEGAVEAFMENASDLLDGLLPELMRCLPDWAEVEAGRYPADSPLVGLSTLADER